jgi:hypothetical protein
MDTLSRDLLSERHVRVVSLLRDALDRLHGDTRAAGSRALALFSKCPMPNCCPPEQVAGMLPHFLGHLNANELRLQKGEFVVCLGFGTFLGCTVDDKTLKLVVFKDGNYQHSNLSGIVNRAAASLLCCGTRIYSPVIFSLPRVPGRLERSSGKKLPSSYRLAWEQRDPLDLPGPETFSLLNARQTEPYQELATLPPSVAITDAPPGSEASILCAGTFIIRHLPNGEYDTVLILDVQDTHSESLAFPLVGLHVRTKENRLEKPVQLTIHPNSNWKIIGAQRVRLLCCSGELFALPVIGEPRLSLWAIGEHIARVQDKHSKDVFYDLSMKSLSPMFGLRRMYPVNAVLVAVADARNPYYYGDVEEFNEDVSPAIAAATAAAGDREASAEKLIKAIRPSWALSTWKGSGRIYLPAHGPLTATIFDWLADDIRFRIDDRRRTVSPTGWLSAIGREQ